MKVLVVFAHPTSDSFNGSLLDVVISTLKDRGAEVRLRNLYEDRFQPVLDSADLAAIHGPRGVPLPDVLREQIGVAWANRLIFLYPIWWYDRPAILKGWIDRVFLPGFAYRPDKTGGMGLLKHEKALVLQTAGNSEAQLRKSGALEVMQKTMGQGTLTYCGIPEVRIETLCEVTRVSDEERKAMLERVAGIIQGW